MRTIVYFVLVIFLTAVFIKSPITADLMAFFLTGAIPGTQANIPATFMLAAYGSAVVLVLIHFTGINIRHIRLVRRLIRQQITARERFPRRRYSELSS